MNDSIKRKISDSVKAYYLTEKGISHKKKLASTMRDRMRLYNEFLVNNENNNNFKNTKSNECI